MKPSTGFHTIGRISFLPILHVKVVDLKKEDIPI